MAEVMTATFDGVTYDESLDRERLRGQWLDVWRVMAAPKIDNWFTLSELRALTGHPESSISARIRDFRKPQFGGHFVYRRRRGTAERGLFEYRLVVRRPPPEQASLFGDAARAEAGT